MGPDEPEEREFTLRAGRFRGLEWPGDPGRSSCSDVAVFLHGLSGTADVWNSTITALAHTVDGPPPRCVAIDQRGHGRSPHLPGRYSALDYLDDLMDLVEVLGGRVRLVGHSMGARIAIIAAARHPECFSSVVIVDIGPEAWRRNISATVKLLSARPERFADRVEAMPVARFIVGERGEAAAQAFVDDHLRHGADGSYTWLATREALIDSVTVQRGRNYWGDWERISIPLLLVRGGDSDELRPHVADAMGRRNPRVHFTEIDGVGHNIPMLAPDRLAEVIGHFWSENE